MQTHKAKRVEIIIEAPMEGRLTAALEKAGVTGFTVLPVLGGSGRSGRWTRDGQVGRSGMVAVVCLLRTVRREARGGAACAVVDRQRGVIGVTDAGVLGAEGF